MKYHTNTNGQIIKYESGDGHSEDMNAVAGQDVATCRGLLDIAHSVAAPHDVSGMKGPVFGDVDPVAALYIMFDAQEQGKTVDVNEATLGTISQTAIEKQLNDNFFNHVEK